MRQVSRYHPLLVSMHWLMAVLIIAALALGAMVMAKLPNTAPMKFEALRSHMIGGSIIGVLMVLRLFVRARTAHPEAATTANPLLDRVAWVSHRALYVALLAQVATGLVMAIQTDLPRILFSGGVLPADFWEFPIRTVHYLVSRALMCLIALHIVGALYHTFVLRDGLLKRMLFGRRLVQLPEPSETRGMPLRETRR